MAWEKVGEISVDAGLCWVGDPCYILHREGPEDTPAAIGWSEFCDKLNRGGMFDKAGSLQFDHSPGNSGLGVVVSTGYGDGVYPVYIRKNAEGRVVAVKVKF